MIGDLIFCSPCLKIIKDNNKNCHVTLICSDYNYKIAKNYSYIDKLVIINKKKLLQSYFKNFKTLFLTKYKYLFQFDGMSRSYFISYFMRSKIKSTVCFIKHKKIFGINYFVSRPPNILLKLFFKNYVFCNEKYSVTYANGRKIHYQSNYFEIFKKLDFSITGKKNLFTLDKNYEKNYEYLYKKYISQKFSLFHFDEKWNKFKQIDFDNSLKIINKLSKKNKIIITTGLKEFAFINNLRNNFNIYDYNKSSFISENKDNDNVIILENLPLNLLAYFIKNSELNLSAHSGPIVHISATFDKQIVDLVPESKNNELDRWVPTISNYKRINFENINRQLIESF